MSINIISPTTVKNESWVQDNVDSDFIEPIIQDVELMKVEPIIGATLYTEILDQIDNNTVTVANAALLEYIKPMEVKYVLEKLVFALNNQITNTGVISKDNQNGASLPVNSMYRTTHEFKSDAEFYKARLVKYMCDNNFTVYTNKVFTTSINFNGKNNNRKNISTKG